MVSILFYFQASSPAKHLPQVHLQVEQRLPTHADQSKAMSEVQVRVRHELETNGRV